MKKTQIWKGILILLSLLLVAVLAASCGGEKTETPDGGTTEPAKKVHIRLVCPSPKGDDLTEKDERFAQRFNERAADYGYEIKVYSGGTLVKITEFLDAVRTGAVEMFDAAPAIYAGQEPRFNITMLPYLFEDAKAIDYAQDDLIEFYDQICQERFNQKVVGHLYIGSFDMFTVKKPVKSPADVEKMLLGCPDPAIIAIASELKSVSINVPWPDFYTSLDKGVVDGVIHSLNGFIANKLTDICKYYTDFQTPVSTNMYTINLDIWKAMPKEVQDILLEEMNKTCKEASQYYIDRYEGDIETIKSLGMEVHRLTPEEKAQFKAILQPFTERELAKYGEDGKKIKEIADRANEATR